MSEAMRALYEGDGARARDLLRPDGELSVFEAAAFGRLARLGELLDEDPSRASAFSEDGFTALHLAIFGGQEGAVRLLLERGADPNVLSRADIAKVVACSLDPCPRSIMVHSHARSRPRA